MWDVLWFSCFLSSKLILPRYVIDWTLIMSMMENINCFELLLAKYESWKLVIIFSRCKKFPEQTHQCTAVCSEILLRFFPPKIKCDTFWKWGLAQAIKIMPNKKKQASHHCCVNQYDFSKKMNKQRMKIKCSCRMNGISSINTRLNKNIKCSQWDFVKVKQNFSFIVTSRPLWICKATLCIPAEYKAWILIH